jgi:3-deoxy-D-manno-octulosonic-acid transferase
MLLDAYLALKERHPALRLVLVPRKTERFDEAEREIAVRKLVCVRKTALDAQGGAKHRLEGGEVLLCDTLGELAKLYEAADVVFLGRSLVPFGGSDMLEPGALGRPLVFGPHTENFPDLAAELVEAGGALRLEGPGGLARTIEDLARDPEKRRRIGENARKVIDRNRGATRRTLDVLDRIVGLGARSA